jgi:hypothetical protein
MSYKIRLLPLISITLSLFLIPSLAGAVPSADLVYFETAIEGGWYQYDYTVYNTSTAGETLWDIGFWFNEDATLEWLNAPTGWSTNPSPTFFMAGFAEAWTETDQIPANDSLSGFRFKIDYQAGDMDFDSYYNDSTGVSYVGVSRLAPEPVSSILFLSGGATLVVRSYLRRIKRGS